MNKQESLISFFCNKNKNVVEKNKNNFKGQRILKKKTLLRKITNYIKAIFVLKAIVKV